MHRTLTVGAVALIALASAPAFAKPPNWVRPIDRPISEAPADPTGIHWHLSDTQVRHVLGSIETYRREAFSVHTDEDIAAVTKLWFDKHLVSIDFVRIRRGDKTIEVSTATRPEVDEDVEFQVVVLPELAKGDVIDYAWLDQSPADEMFIAGWRDLSSGHDWTRFRLLVPSKADVKVAIDGSDTPFKRDLVGEYLEYVWEGEPHRDPHVADAPAWYFQTPILAYSGLGSWDDLGKILAERYGVAEPPSQAVTDLAASLAALDDPPVERAMAAAKYVQQSIRYRIVFDGPPRALDEVVESGEGSPLERALLLSALARALGLDASIGLANERYQGRIETMLPVPDVVPRPLTGVRIEDEHVVWIDPIGHDYASQGFTTPTVEAALLLDPKAPGIVGVPTIVPFEPSVDCRELYELDDDGGALLTITTTLRREYAETMRDRLNRESTTEVSKTFTNRAHSMDETIELLAPVEFADDTVENEIVVTERYRIDEFWRTGVWVLQPREIGGVLMVPGATRARAPLAISHPEHIRHSMEVGPLPDAFDVQPIDRSIETDGFVIDLETHLLPGRRLEVSWDYRSRAPHVAADRLAHYQRGLDTPLYAYELRWLRPDHGSPYWHRYLMIVGGFIVLGGGLQTLERRRVLKRATARVMTRSEQS